jgi:hypothetical protein
MDEFSMKSISKAIFGLFLPVLAVQGAIVTLPSSTGDAQCSSNSDLATVESASACSQSGEGGSDSGTVSLAPFSALTAMASDGSFTFNYNASSP